MCSHIIVKHFAFSLGLPVKTAQAHEANSPRTSGSERQRRQSAGADAGERPCGLRDLLGLSVEALAGSKLVYVQQETEIHNIGLKCH